MSRRRASVLFRDGLHYRKSCFSHGLEVNGFEVCSYIGNPTENDLIVVWNRSLRSADDADRFARAGATVLVAENGLLGKHWKGGNWYSLAFDHVAGAGGHWPHGGPSRWDSFGIDLKPWRTGGDEVVFMGQRSIGERGIKSPPDWAQQRCRELGGRVRLHPGKHDPTVTLEEDLSRARACATWASSAGLQALVLGVPVWYEHPNWVGGPASRHISEWGTSEPVRDDELRISMFRRVAWAMWNIEEIDSGEAFRHLLLSAQEDRRAA